MLATNWPENIVFTTNVPWRLNFSSPYFRQKLLMLFRKVFMMNKPLSSSNKHLIYFSVPMGISRWPSPLRPPSTTLGTWRGSPRQFTTRPVRWRKRQNLFFIDRGGIFIFLDGCWIFPVWRANLCHEVWELDLRRISSEYVHKYLSLDILQRRVACWNDIFALHWQRRWNLVTMM